MALKGKKHSKEAIHHSERGVQYCCGDYVQCIEKASLSLSMTKKGDPYENAIAERVNGILKTEFGLSGHFTNNTQHPRQWTKLLMFITIAVLMPVAIT